jgi:8-oxo-dGTP pyrophosphatase MutT (NUDIX family)
MAKPTHHRTGGQFAALPVRIKEGSLEILLITSREAARWVIPKGWPTRGLRPRDVAAREAFEEAGLVGRIVGKRSIGSYYYIKRLPENQERLCRVKVFLLLVDHQVEDWPEKGQREFQWVTPQRAAYMVDECGLSQIVRAALPAARFLTSKEAKRSRLPLVTAVNRYSRAR